MIHEIWLICFSKKSMQVIFMTWVMQAFTWVFTQGQKWLQDNLWLYSSIVCMKLVVLFKLPMSDQKFIWIYFWQSSSCWLLSYGYCLIEAWARNLQKSHLLVLLFLSDCFSWGFVQCIPVNPYSLLL